MTTDAGQTWTNATAPLGLPNVQVSEIKGDQRHRHPSTLQLTARQMWRIGMLPDVAQIASLTLNPTTACDGTPVTATVTLQYPAPTGGALINIATTDAVNTTRSRQHHHSGRRDGQYVYHYDQSGVGPEVT